MQSQPGNYTFNALSQYRKMCLLLSTCSIMQLPFVAKDAPSFSFVYIHP